MNAIKTKPQPSGEIFQGFYIFGILGLAGLMLAGIAFDNKSAVVIAISSASLAYLAQLAASVHVSTGSDSSRNLNLAFICLSLALFVGGLAKLAYG